VRHIHNKGVLLPYDFGSLVLLLLQISMKDFQISGTFLILVMKDVLAKDVLMKDVLTICLEDILK
jgi:hypothetical protein